MTRNGAADMQLYIVSFNGETFYVSDAGINKKDPDIFKRVIANIGYRGCISFKPYEKEYVIWKNILYRCYWPNSNLYEYYGALGVTVDPRWHCFEFFLYDIFNTRNYDIFRDSRRVYDMDLSKQMKLPPNERCYAPGKCIIRPLAQTDVSQALDKAQAKGRSSESGAFLDPKIVHQQMSQPQIISYDALPNGDYPDAAYEQTIRYPPNLPIPHNDDLGYDTIRILGGVIKRNAPQIKPTTTVGKKVMCVIMEK